MPPFVKINKKTSDYLYILLGSFCIATAYVFFNAPHRIVPGGVYGISIIIHDLTQGVFSWFPNGLPMGATALVFNIPLAIIAYRVLGHGSALKTVFTFVSTAVFTDVLSKLQGKNYIIPDQHLLAAIYGGVLIGVGVSFIFKAKGTSAGTDVIAKIISKYSRVQVGFCITLVDSLVVIIGLVAFGDWAVPLYSWITIFVYGRVVDFMQSGLQVEKAVFIISDKSHAIKELLLRKMDRGGTYFHGKGMYSGKEKEIIYAVMPARDVYVLRELVTKEDPEAFMTVLPASEILGKGFRPLQMDEFN